MNTNKQKKSKVASFLREELLNSEFIAIVHYRGMNDKQLFDLRVALKSKNCSMKIAKNTLVKLAVADTELAPLASHLKGPNALLFSKDSIALAKILVKVANENKKLHINVGCLSKSIIDKKVIESLAKLGTIEEVRSSFVGMLLSVPTNFVRTISASQQNLVSLLSGYADSKK